MPTPRIALGCSPNPQATRLKGVVCPDLHALPASSHSSGVSWPPGSTWLQLAKGAQVQRLYALMRESNVELMWLVDPVLVIVEFRAAGFPSTNKFSVCWDPLQTLGVQASKVSPFYSLRAVHSAAQQALSACTHFQFPTVINSVSLVYARWQPCCL